MDQYVEFYKETLEKTNFVYVLFQICTFVSHLALKVSFHFFTYV